MSLFTKFWSKVRPILIRWRTLYLITALICGLTYTLFHYGNLPYRIEQGHTVAYVYGGPLQLIIAILLIASAIGVMLIVIRTMLMSKDLRQTALMFAAYVLSVYLFLAFMGPAIGGVALANYEHIQTQLVDGKNYTLGYVGASSNRTSAYILFECDRFMLRCKVLYSETNYRSTSHTPHLSISDDQIELILDGDVAYTHPSP